MRPQRTRLEVAPVKLGLAMSVSETVLVKEAAIALKPISTSIYFKR